MKKLNITILFLLLIVAISCSKQIKMDKKQHQIVKKGNFKGTIIPLPNKEKIKTVQFVLSPQVYFNVFLDTLGNFTTKELEYGTYQLKIYNEEKHYPILIKEITLNKKTVNLGKLPLFKEPYGYQTEWGTLASEDGENFYYRNPIFDKNRIVVEKTYQSLFSAQFKNKKLTFKTIDMNKDTTDNTIEDWRFSVLEILKTTTK